MFRGYNISEDLSALCCEDFCDVNGKGFQRLMAEGKEIWDNLSSDNEIKVTKCIMKSFDNADVPLIVFEPHNIERNAPCVVYYHGGGFVMGLMEYHLNAIRNYVLGVSCKLVCVDYRLSPENPFPIAVKDCYEALLWTVKNAEKLDIDINRIAVAGDSAGGYFSAVISQMSRDKKGPHICFQMLSYPYVDHSMSTESNKKFTDTPVWNSEGSKVIFPLYYQNEYSDEEKPYASPIEAKDFSNLPKAFIEVSEFDCLRDEGLAYAEKLKTAGVETQVVETIGTVHAYDILTDCDTTRKYMKMRVDALKKAFNLQ